MKMRLAAELGQARNGKGVFGTRGAHVLHRLPEAAPEVEAHCRGPTLRCSRTSKLPRPDSAPAGISHLVAHRSGAGIPVRAHGYRQSLQECAITCYDTASLAPPTLNSTMPFEMVWCHVTSCWT